MMLADAPRYIRKKVNSEESEVDAETEAQSIVQIYQSNLKQ